MSINLILLPGRAGIAACVLLDYQDAVIGPASYDLVSVLEGCAARCARLLSPRAMVARYSRRVPAQDRAAFAASYAVHWARNATPRSSASSRGLRARRQAASCCNHIPRSGVF